MDKAPCKHDRVQKDYFADLPGVSRYVPGNAVCADCGEPIPLQIPDEGIVNDEKGESK